ncbi:MAG: UbiD family decarboxylase, partial [Proteobacteria bacterium]|nr:UbiD family decarboxylase [Pseudomonadota bacterium]
MAFADLRETVDALRERGRLIEVEEEVRAAHEAAAVLAVAGDQDRGAVFFRRIAGHRVPVVGNVVCGREVLGWALGVAEAQVAEELGRRISRPMDPVPAADAPVLEETGADGVPLERLFPILTHHGSDSAPYITTGLVSAVDPETGNPARGI